MKQTLVRKTKSLFIYNTIVAGQNIWNVLHGRSKELYHVCAYANIISVVKHGGGWSFFLSILTQLYSFISVQCETQSVYNTFIASHITV